MSFFSILACIFLLILSSCKNKESPDTFSLREGDLLFQDSDCGPFCTAIEKVTFGHKGAKFSHIGLVIKENDKLKVLEAISAGVVLTPIDTFLNRSFDTNKKPKVVVGRLVSDKKTLIPQAIEFTKDQRQKEYDDVFDITNDKYYCSELIYDAFKYANEGNPLFDLQPMTFLDPETEETFPIWKEYFDNLGTSIPEGKLGLNPGGISTSPYIELIYFYGKPDGFQE